MKDPRVRQRTRTTGAEFFLQEYGDEPARDVLLRSEVAK